MSRIGQRRLGWAAAVVALALGFGCGGGADAGPLEGPVARFEPVAAGVPAWGDVPFPSDLYRDSNGAVALDTLPSVSRSGARDVRTLALLSARSGFCATCNVYFRIDGAIDESTVPTSVSPDATASPDDPIVLADVDPDSPDRGRLYPLRVQWDGVHGLLALRPVRGVALREGRTYAAVLTDALADPEGNPLRPSEAFRAVRDGGGDAADDAARAVIGPALDALAEAGIGRSHVVDAAVFTTEQVTAPLLALRQAVWSAPTPVATVDQVWTGAALDDLMGAPAEDRPGADVPSDPTTDGDRAVVHATTAVVVSGTFEAPRFVTGSGLDVGEADLDAEGLPVPGPLESVPFVLIVPAGVDVSQLAVTVHHHGFNASRTTGFVLADTAGAAGVAVLAIDGYQHGDRAASAVDEIHNLRGSPGPDGFAETNMFDVSARVFGVGGVAPGLQLFAGYPLGAFLQLAADAMAAIRLCAEGDLSAIQAAAPALATLAFDPDHVFYSGNSMGAVVGTSVVAVEPTIAAAVLNVQPGSVIETLAESPAFRSLTEALLLPVLGVTGPFDEVDRHLVFDPTVDVMRWALEPIDPLALAPYLFTAPDVPGPRPDTLIQVASLDEVAGVAPTESFLAAAGIPGDAGGGDFPLAPVAPAALPASANLDTPAGPSTVAAAQFGPAQHGMLEVKDQTSVYEAPVVPPFQPRPADLAVRNPIEAVHAQIGAFWASRLAGMHATIE